METRWVSIIRQCFILAVGFVCARGVKKADVKGDAFPVAEVLITTVVAFGISGVIGGLAAWKSEAIDRFTEKLFYKMGSAIATHPYKFLMGSVVLILPLGYGMGLQKAELDPAKLWVPTGAVAIEQNNYVKATWPADSTPVFLTAKSGSNILTPANLAALQQDVDAMMAFVVDGDELIKLNKDAKIERFAGKWTFDGRGNTSAKCYRFGQDCALRTLLRVFGYPKPLPQLTPASIRSTLKAWDSAPLNTYVPSLGAFKDFELKDVLGEMTRDNDGSVSGATMALTSMFLTSDEAEVKSFEDDQVNLQDPITMTWEADVVCLLGIEEEHPHTGDACTAAPSGFKYTGLLSRSFPDEFGKAIRGDLSKIIISYVLIVVYLVLNLGKRDKVHSMMALSAGVLLVIGFAYTMSNGIGGLLGVKTNPLNNNIPFLLLGLGVDDAFVLVSEFVRHSSQNPEASIVHRAASAAQTGGMSVLVTSLTDALAFLVGSSTRLPALSGFCIYAGIGVLGCFLFMFTVFIPLIVFNARRADSNRFDCCCCCKSSVEHKLEQPQGFCSCIPFCFGREPSEPLTVLAFRKFSAATIETMPGRITTAIVFLIVFVVGMTGLVQLEKEFRLEWFFPPDSYVNEYFDINREYFSRGADFSIYANGVDIYGKQKELTDVHTYVGMQDFMMPGSVREAWFTEFTTAKQPFKDSASFYQQLYAWTRVGSGGAKYKKAMIWTDAACNGASCTLEQQNRGIAHAQLAKATLKQESNGRIRYETYRTMREDITEVFGAGDGMKVFPFTMDFLYWEEVGVIDVELVKNLLIACAVVLAIVALLIPIPRIFLIVAFNIIAAIVEVIGFAHYFGVTMNGVSTIYFLICAGLAVDYSAHIAHTFKDCIGSAQERASAALLRIGPSVWNAIFSTLMAVVVLGFSKSFVFIVFFKVLFLVSTIAGAHGLWLLPVMLSVLGGAKEAGKNYDDGQGAQVDLGDAATGA